MDLILAQEVASVVAAMDVAMLGLEEETRVTDVATLATHLTDQVLDVKMDHLRFEPTITALVRPILARNASIRCHNI